MCDIKKDWVSMVAIILSIGAIVSVGMLNMESDSTKIAEIEQRLDEQQSVILQTWGMANNSTVFNANQFEFNSDVIRWAGNVTAKIDAIASQP